MEYICSGSTKSVTIKRRERETERESVNIAFNGKKLWSWLHQKRKKTFIAWVLSHSLVPAYIGKKEYRNESNGSEDRVVVLQDHLSEKVLQHLNGPFWIRFYFYFTVSYLLLRYVQENTLRSIILQLTVSSLNGFDLAVTAYTNYKIFPCLVKSHRVKQETRSRCHKQI